MQARQPIRLLLVDSAQHRQIKIAQVRYAQGAHRQRGVLQGGRAVRGASVLQLNVQLSFEQLQTHLQFQGGVL